MSASRREFLRYGAGLSFVTLGGAVPGLLARAAEESARVARTDGVLVVVELTGGNDGLNTLVPIGDSRYNKARPTLGIPAKDAIRLTDQFGFHPRMAAMAELFKEGRLAVVQGVGYPEPDRSHFRSMEIWHTASLAKRPFAAGWLGKYLDATVPEQGREPLRGLALAGPLPQALRGEKGSSPVLGQLDALSTEADVDLMRRKLANGPGASQGPLAFLRQQASSAYQVADRLKAATAAESSPVEYPQGELGDQLRQAAKILALDVGSRVIYASQGGYDTHSEQANEHGELLGTLAQSLAAFDKDLAARKLADRVIVLVFSEFGRRVEENASRGTDHGAASCAFLMGRGVRGGLAGRHPGLDTLDEGDLIHTTDFRSVYATLLQRWLGCSPIAVLGREFPMLDLIGVPG